MSADIEFSAESAREMGLAIQRLGEVSGKTAQEVITSQARLFCADLAFITRPIGKSATTGRDHAAKIANQIDEIYWNVGQAVEALKSQKGEGVAQSFQRAIRKRNYPQASAILMRSIGNTRWEVGPWDNGNLHKTQRFNKRVSTRRVIIEKGALTRYKAQEAKQSGFAKAGFAAAARDLGGVRGIPGFVTRHQSAPGAGRSIRTGDDITVSIENHVEHIEHAFDSSLESIALNTRARKIESLIKRIIRNAAKKISPSLK